MAVIKIVAWQYSTKVQWVCQY